MITFKELLEAKKLVVFDTKSETDADDIKKVLKKDKIKYSQTGLILSLELDPKLSQTLISRLHKIADFDEVK